MLLIRAATSTLPLVVVVVMFLSVTGGFNLPASLFLSFIAVILPILSVFANELAIYYVI